MNGWELRVDLAELGMKQVHLARRLGYHADTVSDWCNGDRVPDHVKEYMRVLKLAREIVS